MTVKCAEYVGTKKVLSNNRKLNGISISIAESLTALQMVKLKNVKDKYIFHKTNTFFIKFSHCLASSW